MSGAADHPTILSSEISEPPGQPAQQAGTAPEWTTLMAPNEWEVYQAAIHAVRAAGVRFMLGGAFGLATYTGRWRNTKDIDFFMLPRDRETAIASLTRIGFKDYYETWPYDRGWIYRATQAGVIVDVIWGTPNRRTQVDEDWFNHAGRLLLRTEVLDVIPAEELVWIKSYVLQRDRCDWPDLINLLYAKSGSLNWDRLVNRFEDDLPLLKGLLQVFAWVCPNRIAGIPPTLRKRVGIAKPKRTAANLNLERIKLLDTRPWFAAQQPETEAMQI